MLTRTLTAIVLLAVVVGALFLDPTGWAVKVLIVIIAFIAENELARIIGIGGSCVGTIGILGITGSKASSQFDYYICLVVAVIGAAILAGKTRTKSLFLLYLSGGFWISGTLGALYSLATTKTPSFWPLLLTAAIPIWCGDTAAIFIGKAFGKHPMAPEISPKKTWEGATGNFLACVIAALVLGAIFHYPMLPMILLGLNCGIVGQAGDLFESWLKRKADMKDSGNILPGHGGLLDRIDSLMATAPVSLLILQTLMIPGKP